MTKFRHHWDLNRGEDPSVALILQSLVDSAKRPIPKFDDIFALLFRQKVGNSFLNFSHESLELSLEGVAAGPAVGQHEVELVFLADRLETSFFLFLRH